MDIKTVKLCPDKFRMHLPFIWKDGTIPTFDSESTIVKVPYICINRNPLSIGGGQLEIDCRYMIQEVLTMIKTLLGSFPTENVSNILDLHRISCNISKNTLRDAGNLIIENTIIYNNNIHNELGNLDGPFSIVEFRNKFGLIVHPEYLNYGYNLNLTNHITIDDLKRSSNCLL